MSTPVRLAKKPEVEHGFEARLNHYAPIIVPALIILMIFFIMMIIAVIMGHVSATESGMWFNHLKDVI